MSNISISEFLKTKPLLSETIETDFRFNLLKNRSIDTARLLKIGYDYLGDEKLLKWSQSINN